jgi:hypothetical protein
MTLSPLCAQSQNRFTGNEVTLLGHGSRVCPHAPDNLFAVAFQIEPTSKSCSPMRAADVGGGVDNRFRVNLANSDRSIDVLFDQGSV